MEIRVLKYFIESAKLQNITKAANKLNLTQPNLSRQLKDLEVKLGQKLFIRTNYKIILTKEGEMLYKRACDILDLVDKTEQEFKNLKDFNGGDVYIGCAESIGIVKIARTAKKLQNKNIKFHIFSGNYENVVNKLQNSLIDFAVVVQEFDISNFSYLDLNHSDTWGIIMKNTSKYAKQKDISINDLFQMPLIVSRQGFTQEMPNVLRQNQDKLNIVATYDLLYNAAIFVKEDIGYALSLDKLINTNDDLCFKPINPLITSNLRLIWIDDKLSDVARIFLKELQKDLKN
ncbi:LysR family transcriptional regulator [Campylobacter sp. RM9333]|uniref:LysR family transcriptional regulator n=1 Tax=Campylobacter sp. RM9333 TaxID=2735731 RepID=UPI001DB06F97|nr:LysR family transcriptional regulator [Campylobacter sp. RM9333]